MITLLRLLRELRSRTCSGAHYRFFIESRRVKWSQPTRDPNSPFDLTTMLQRSDKEMREVTSKYLLFWNTENYHSSNNESTLACGYGGCGESTL